MIFRKGIHNLMFEYIKLVVQIVGIIVNIVRILQNKYVDKQQKSNRPSQE